jgi:NAD(P)-dependent dehydrogenase (short-subunit alcohol dehydrogenase family)
VARWPNQSNVRHRAVSDAVKSLASFGLDVHSEVLDVTSQDSVLACAARLEARSEHVDVLVNNAGVYPEGDLLAVASEVLTETMAINFYGALWTSRAWMPAMNRRSYGRIVNVTSGYGCFSEGLEGPPAYAISKAALNALTVRLGVEARGDVKVNAACPGWVQTRMGGPGAPKTVQQGADTIVWLPTLPADGPTGGLFRKRQRVAW